MKNDSYKLISHIINESETQQKKSSIAKTGRFLKKYVYDDTADFMFEPKVARFIKH